MNRLETVAAVVIGRNEGERLKRGLSGLMEQVGRIVYVDSGSRDDSVAFARRLGVEVVELDMSRPFTAARARNAGAEALMASGPRPEYIQFMDGDCQLVPGWITAALDHISTRPGLGIVTGWRAEIHPEASVYNAMCDVEWHRPAGPIIACGGDMLVRTAAFEDVEGLDPSLIAGEDEEFCLRIAQAGWHLERLPLPMTRHDAAMTRFSQWWQRAVRAGHAFAQIGRMHPQHFVNERRRILFYGVILPLMALLGVIVTATGATLAGVMLMLGVIMAYGLNWLRTAQGLRRDGLPGPKAAHHALFLTVSKYPNLIGVLTYHLRRLRSRDMHLIEYK